MYFSLGLESDTPILESLWWAVQPTLVSILAVRQLSYERTVELLRRADEMHVKHPKWSRTGLISLTALKTMRDGRFGPRQPSLFCQYGVMVQMHRVISEWIQLMEELMTTTSIEALHREKAEFMDIYIRIQRFLQYMPLEMAQEFSSWARRLVEMQPLPCDVIDAIDANFSPDPESAKKLSFRISKLQDWG